jgi:hypothetical protein
MNPETQIWQATDQLIAPNADAAHVQWVRAFGDECDLHTGLIQKFLIRV